MREPKQSIALAHAKHCIGPRKALHWLTQSIALAHAKHCIGSRKSLHWLTQSFAVTVMLILGALSDSNDYECRLNAV